MDRKEKEILGAAVVMLLAFGFLAIFQPWKNAFKSDNMDAQGENEPTDNQWQNGENQGDNADLEIDMPQTSKGQDGGSFSETSYAGISG